MNYNRAVMKQEVRQAMRQTQSNPMVVTLVYLIVVNAGTQVVSGIISTVNNLLPGGSISIDDLIGEMMRYGPDYVLSSLSPYVTGMLIRGLFFSMVISIAATVWSGLMNVGYSGYCLDMSRNRNPQLGRIFGGFPLAGTAIFAYLLVAIFTFLWSLLFGVGLFLVIGIAAFLISVSDALTVLGVLLIFAASVLYAAAIIWAVYRYVMVPYVIVDSQNPMSPMEAVNASKALMKGRKGSYFVLQLSFIGWQLLKVLAVLAGAVIVAIVAAGSLSLYGDDLEYILYAAMTGNSDAVRLLAQALGPSLILAVIVILVCSIGIFILDLWLTPYRTGGNARFYSHAAGIAQPIQPNPYQPGPYGGWPGPYGSQSGPYSGQSGPYGGQSGPYGGQSGPYGGQPGPYGSQSGPYGGQSGPYGGQSGPYGGQPGPYGSQPGPYGGQSGQSSFGGYTQVERPSQYGTGTSPQWGAPQAPQPPQTPLSPQAPASAETELLAPPEPAPDATVLFEAPYADESEEPEDDTPQRPSGPSYPQY